MNPNEVPLTTTSYPGMNILSSPGLKILQQGSVPTLPSYSPSTSTLTSGRQTVESGQALLDSISKQLKAMQTPTPRLADFDIAASWDKARQMATNAVSPIYQQKMTDYINKEYTKNIERANADAITGKSALDLALERMLEDTQIQRERVGEDTATGVADVNAAQRYAEREQGLGFDAAYRALNENLGASGMAGSGLGAQQATENIRAFRAMSNEQLRQSENKIEALNTLMTRSFQDLETREDRAETDTEAGKTKIDLDLERFIQDEEDRLDTFRKDQELAKQMEIVDRSSGLRLQLVDEWLQSLRGQGYTPQEVALAAQIYR